MKASVPTVDDELVNGTISVVALEPVVVLNLWQSQEQTLANRFLSLMNSSERTKPWNEKFSHTSGIMLYFHGACLQAKSGTEPPQATV